MVESTIFQSHRFFVSLCISADGGDRVEIFFKLGGGGLATENIVFFKAPCLSYLSFPYQSRKAKACRIFYPAAAADNANRTSLIGKFRRFRKMERIHRIVQHIVCRVFLTTNISIVFTATTDFYVSYNIGAGMAEEDKINILADSVSNLLSQ